MLNSHQSAERAQRPAGSGSTRWRQSRHHKVSLKWAAADISRPPPRSLLGRAELARHPCRAPLPSPCPKLAPILLAAKRIMLRPAHHEIDIAAVDCEQRNLLQYGIVVLVHYRAAISAGSGRFDGGNPCTRRSTSNGPQRRCRASLADRGRTSTASPVSAPRWRLVLLGRRRGLAHRRWSELGEDRA